MLTNKLLKLTLIIVFCNLAACGKGGEKTASSQIAAKVNGAEITTHQIDSVMKTAQNVTAENVAEFRKKALDKLIDQQLVIEKANKESLDRTPEVTLEIEAAKKEILARAYLKKMLANSSEINDSEFKKYYNEHVELFSKRRVYTLQDISTQNNPQTLALLNEDVAAQKPMMDIVEGLKAKGVKFSSAAFIRPAEQLPLDILPKMQLLKNGDMFLWQSGESAHVLKLTNIEESPVSFIEATPMIKNYFINTRGKKIVEDKIKKFRQEAKIEYMGAFANQTVANSSDTSQVKPAVAETVPAKTSLKNEQVGTKTDSAIEAGVAGLK
ncbi:MAG: EpsD family peptidyl-prolyl cis-trans isomerase [Methylotenera sp.]|uniref:EpsD family peptidyl-prolyl cis-trans isomerase n=1 Tax=Methylotenera sp. TaxID=2051956 RepID=UPI0024887DDD|nr:EpsD family peptidyl-prolyl cis-trans isomerase [Methylotenera sp.]MDI1309677.1 EpsD family peptidyl-prolyl cis-trans isomerase [Methylotenera sp.]